MKEANKKESKEKRGRSLATKLYGLIGVLVAVMVIICIGNLILVNRQKETTRALSEGQINDLKDVTTIIADLQEAQKSFYGYLEVDDKTQKSAFMDEYTKAKEDAVKTFNSFSERVPKESKDQFMSFYNFVQEGIADMDDVIKLAGTAGADSDQIQSKIAKMQDTMNQISTNMSNMSSDCSDRIAGSKASVDSGFNVSSITSAVTLAIIIILAIIIFIVIERAVIRPLRNSTKRLNEIVGKIEAGNGDLTERLDITSDDEIGQISKGINMFIETLQRAMYNIRNGSGTLSNSVNEIGVRIREADDSKSTANGIQEISEMVTKSVNSLAQNASKMLDYIHQVILKDYEVMVGTGTNYHDNAERFKKMMQELQKSASQVKQTMDVVVNSVDGVKSTIAESSTGVENVAINSTDLVSDISNIAQHMESNQQIVESLQKEISRFKNI